MIALTQRLYRGPRGLGRSVLLLIGVTAAIIVGLLAMHALNSPAAHADPAAAVSVHEMADPVHSDAQPLTDDDGCGDCGDHHSMLTMACVLALLVVTLLLLVPGRGVSWMAALRRVGPFPLIWATTLSKPPSLLVLCISRT